jgi:hypothetical protein
MFGWWQLGGGRLGCLVVVGQFPGCSLIGNTLWRCHLSTPRVTLPQGRGGCTTGAMHHSTAAAVQHHPVTVDRIPGKRQRVGCVITAVQTRMPLLHHFGCLVVMGAGRRATQMLCGAQWHSG